MNIDFIPPRKALIEHIKDDGSAVMVECGVDTEYEDGTYWMSYTDPEDDQCVIADAVPGDELRFLA